MTASPSQPALQDAHRRLGDAPPLPRDPRADAITRTTPPPGDWPAEGRTPVTVLVPTKNEGHDIAGTLARLAFAEQRCVVDSGSTDDTVPIAQTHGAEVYHFDYHRDSPAGWPKKRNWALEHLPLRHGWVLLIDADEHVTPELAHEIHGVVTNSRQPSNPGDGRAYWLNRRFMLHGRWVRFGGYYPAWNLRLFHHTLGRFERLTTAGDTRSGDMEVHEHVQLLPAAGTPGYLDHDLLHHEFTDLSEWVEKHNRYSSWEAHVAHHGLDAGLPARLLGPHPQRKRWLKRAAKRAPMRPTLRFLYHYLYRGGFREGRVGLTMARLLACYEAMTLAKETELRLLGARRKVGPQMDAEQRR